MVAHDPAILGSCRLGHFRLGVKKPLFDRAVTKLEKTSAKSLGGMDPAVAGHFRAGQWRAGVYLPKFDEAIARLEKV